MATKTETKADRLRAEAEAFAPIRRAALDESRRVIAETKRLAFAMDAAGFGPTEIGAALGMTRQQARQTLNQKPPAKKGGRS